MFPDPGGFGRAVLRLSAVAVVCAAAASCGPSEEDQAIVRRWLLCEECVHRELEAVRQRGDPLVGLLADALNGPPAYRDTNVRRQYDRTYDELKRRLGRNPDLAKQQYVDHYMSDYRALYRSRAISGLEAIGTPMAKKALSDALEKAKARDLVLRSDVQDQLNEAVAGRWTAISAGLQRTCGIVPVGKAGTAYCWGRNDQGQLGDGTTTGQVRPAPVNGSLEFTSIATGMGWHTCGIAARSAYCWGSNARGELGDGSVTRRLIPTKVASDSTFTGITVGGNHACAWAPTNQGYCWGGNNAGQLGDGTTTDQRQPVIVTSNLGVRTIRAGAMHTCADSLNEVLHCWGLNTDGQLAVGAPGDRTTPAQAAGPVRVKALSVGAFHVCVLAQGSPTIPDGTAYCAGRNDDGQLGNGTTISSDSLTPVAGGIQFLSISAGEGHTCGIVQGARTLRCWGDNEFGQLGNGTEADQSAPDDVAGNVKFTAVSAGAGHTCAITTHGAAYCWGRNNTGQLGIGTTIQSLTPKPVVLAP